MKILLVSGIWPPEVGGPASHGPEFGRFLVDRGHRLRAVTTSDRSGPLDPGFPVKASRKDRATLVRQPAAAAAVFAAARGVDVVYATGMYGRSALASTLRRRPFVLKLVNDPAYERARRFGLFSGTLEDFQGAPAGRAVRALKRLRNLVVSRASRVVVPSGYLAEFAIGWGLPAERVCVVPNPAPRVDRSISRKDLRRRLGLEFPTFVFVGRLTAQKDLPLAISALERLSAGSLVLVGEGPSREDLARRIEGSAAGDRISLKGALPREEAVAWLRAADAAVLPSAWENFPHAAVEALAAGTPVIATSVGGVPEIIQNGVNGILVPPGDAPRLAEAMASLAEDDGRLHTLRSGAIASSERYVQDAAYEAIEAELALAASG